MAHETVYMLQTFNMVGPKTFRFDRPVIYNEFQAALAVVEQTRGKSGLVIHEVTGDPVRMIFDEPIIVHAMGTLPVGLMARGEDVAQIGAEPEKVRLTHRNEEQVARVDQAGMRPSRPVFEPARV